MDPTKEIKFEHGMYFVSRRSSELFVQSQHQGRSGLAKGTTQQAAIPHPTLLREEPKADKNRADPPLMGQPAEPPLGYMPSVNPVVVSQICDTSATKGNPARGLSNEGHQSMEVQSTQQSLGASNDLHSPLVAKQVEAGM